MTTAAIYARYSSDRQRDESIEIQVQYCSDLIEKNDWELAEIYADYAKTGTSDKRPSFQRCMEDAKAKAFDILVIYKLDRFARNVEISRRYKRVLDRAGIRLISVREGEQTNTPDGILQSGISELLAEYYSRNLSVLISDGIQKNAENGKANGRTMFGLSINSEGYYIPHEIEAPIVKELFERYIRGESTNQLAEWFKSIGIRTKFGNPWSRKSISRLLRNEAYMGVYNYSGVRKEDWIPAIVDKELFMAVQAKLDLRSDDNRKNFTNTYYLSSLTYCLDCGKPMCGTSGKSHTGKKYMYYGCINKDGCNQRVNADRLEELILEELSKLLHNEEAINQMVDVVVEYAKEQHSKADMYREELSDCRRRQDNLIKAVEDGMEASAVSERVAALDERITELKKLIAFEEFKVGTLQDRDSIRKFVTTMITRADKNSAKDEVLIGTFIKKIYVNKDKAVIVFKINESDNDDDVSFEQIKALIESNPVDLPRSDRVRVMDSWWSISRCSRTIGLFTNGLTFALMISRK